MVAAVSVIWAFYVSQADNTDEAGQDNQFRQLGDKFRDLSMRLDAAANDQMSQDQIRSHPDMQVHLWLSHQFCIWLSWISCELQNAKHCPKHVLQVISRSGLFALHIGIMSSPYFAHCIHCCLRLKTSKAADGSCCSCDDSVICYCLLMVECAAAVCRTCLISSGGTKAAKRLLQKC